MTDNNENIIYDDIDFPSGDELEQFKCDLSDFRHDGNKKYECKECGESFWGEDADEEDGCMICPECGSRELEETEPDDEELMDEWNWQNQINFDDDIKYGLFENVKGNTIVRGSIGRWDGTHSGMSVDASIKDTFYNTMKDCDYIKIYEDGAGDMHFVGVHHDGRVHVVVRELTAEAKSFMDDEDNESMSASEFIDGAWNLCQPMDYAHKIWGCKSKLEVA